MHEHSVDIAMKLLIRDMALCSLDSVAVSIVAGVSDERGGDDDAVEEGEDVVGEGAEVERLCCFENVLGLFEDVPGAGELDAL